MIYFDHQNPGGFSLSIRAVNPHKEWVLKLTYKIFHVQYMQSACFRFAQRTGRLGNDNNRVALSVEIDRQIERTEYYGPHGIRCRKELLLRTDQSETFVN